MRRLSAACSRMWEGQPMTRLEVKVGVKRVGGRRAGHRAGGADHGGGEVGAGGGDDAGGEGGGVEAVVDGGDEVALDRPGVLVGRLLAVEHVEVVGGVGEVGVRVDRLLPLVEAVE